MNLDKLKIKDTSQDLQQGEDRFRKGMLYFYLFLLSSWYLFYFIEYTISTNLPNIVLNLMGFPFFAGLFYLLRKRNRIAMVGNIITGILFMELLSYFSINGLSLEILVMSFLIPISSFFFTGYKGGAFWTGLVLVFLLYSKQLAKIFNLPDFLNTVDIYTFLIVQGYVTIIVIFYEISNRQQRQSIFLQNMKLVNQKEKLEVILGSIGDGVIVVDNELKIILSNPMVSELSGFAESELLNTKFNEKLIFRFENSGREQVGFLNKVFREDTITSMSRKTILERKDGSVLPVADSAAPIHDTEGKIIGAVIIFRDVTKEREIDKMKTEFLSIASHQLRTPIATIKWIIELMLDQKDKLPKEFPEYIYEINDQAVNMAGLVGDLLNISKIEQGKKFALDPKPTDIEQIFKVQIQNLKITAKKKSINLVLEEMPKRTQYRIDREKFGQVVHNLLSNAIKYSPKNSTVTIGIKESHRDSTVFFIRDQGIGIPEPEQKNMFKKFFRAANVKKIDGNGLGMYIVKEIVEAHKGKIRFESKENKGTTFFIELPK